MKVAVVGGSGFLGCELLRILAGHPELDVALVTAGSSAGELVSDRHPSLAGAYRSVRFEATDVGALAGLDLVFFALPHGRSQQMMGQVLSTVGAVVDLAADFRLSDPASYESWYKERHVAPELIGRFAMGIPELFRQDILGSRAVAVAGCYPTAASLVLAPLLARGLVSRSGIVVDAASGVSGAGGAPSRSKLFATVDGDFRAYGLANHRHTPEMEQVLGASVIFTPHLAPMSRGILATCYGRVRDAATSTAEAMSVLRDAYDDEPFVVVTDDPPSTKATAGSNCAHLSVVVDQRTGWAIGTCALDNLVKGGSGQGVQCANLVLGLAEGTGLPLAGVSP
ncbi:MAG: N-acetyl-gamma-glutamyl-phosphate reductase [Acidimicrobiales bacterium]